MIHFGFFLISKNSIRNIFSIPNFFTSFSFFVGFGTFKNRYFLVFTIFFLLEILFWVPNLFMVIRLVFSGSNSCYIPKNNGKWFLKKIVFLLNNRKIPIFPDESKPKWFLVPIFEPVHFFHNKNKQMHRNYIVFFHNFNHLYVKDQVKVYFTERKNSFKQNVVLHKKTYKSIMRLGSKDYHSILITSFYRDS